MPSETHAGRLWRLLQLKRLEGVGLTREQAEALTRFLATTLCTNHEKMEELYVAKVTLEKVRQETTVRCCGGRHGRNACHWPLHARVEPLEHHPCPACSPPAVQSILEQEARHAGFRSEVLKSQELQVQTACSVGRPCRWGGSWAGPLAPAACSLPGTAACCG